MQASKSPPGVEASRTGRLLIFSPHRYLIPVLSEDPLLCFDFLEAMHQQQQRQRQGAAYDSSTIAPDAGDSQQQLLQQLALPVLREENRMLRDENEALREMGEFMNVYVALERFHECMQTHQR